MSTQRLRRYRNGSALLFLLLLVFLVVWCLDMRSGSARAADLADIKVPTPRREFRGVWIATVVNDDWPSRRDLTTEEQKAELITLLDRAKQLNMNAVVFQVRPACDALYASPIEPWSEYLTGAMGKAPSDPTFDPLAFAVAEAHRRGMELHAWFNPFRARLNTDAPGTIAPGHISRTHPEWVRQYGKMLWLDPGEPAARDYSLSVIRDVVHRYDIDGVHIDDYFYPYRITDAQKQEVDFPDDAPWNRYVASGGKMGRSDWRRANIDDFVQRMYVDVKKEKPWVKVGISPFGIWRPGNPPQIKGFDSYEKLYGDSRRWLREGWGDYFSPQLYWRIEQTDQSFPVLLSWWVGENAKQRHIWPGLYTGRATGGGRRPSSWPPEEIAYQIKATRGIAGATGDVHFSANFLLSGTPADANTVPGVLSRLVYQEPALVPASPWLAPANGAAPRRPDHVDAGPVASPGASAPSAWNVSWSPQGDAPWQWVVQWRVNGVWSIAVLPGSATTFTASRPAPDPIATPPTADAVDVVAVTAVDRVGAASDATLSAL